MGVALVGLFDGWRLDRTTLTLVLDGGEREVDLAIPASVGEVCKQARTLFPGLKIFLRPCAQALEDKTGVIEAFSAPEVVIFSEWVRSRKKT